TGVQTCALPILCLVLVAIESSVFDPLINFEIAVLKGISNEYTIHLYLGSTYILSKDIKTVLGRNSNPETVILPGPDVRPVANLFPVFTFATLFTNDVNVSVPDAD